MRIVKSNLRSSVSVYPQKMMSLISDVFGFQVSAYKNFLFSRDENSLFSIVKSFFPISDLFGNFEIELLDVSIKQLRNLAENDCLRLGLTYSSVVQVRLRIKSYARDENGVKTILSVSDQDVDLFEIPLINSNGKFIMNGVERVVVSQIHRSPGLIFTRDGHGSSVKHRASIIPYNGTWIDFEVGISKEDMFVILDKKRKISLGSFFSAIGISKEKLLSHFYQEMEFNVLEDSDQFFIQCKNIDQNAIKGSRFSFNIYDKNKNVIIKAGEIITHKRSIDVSKDEVLLKVDELNGNIFLFDSINDISAGSSISSDLLKDLIKAEQQIPKLINILSSDFSDSIIKCLEFYGQDHESDALNLLKMMRRSEMIISIMNESAVQSIRSFIFDGSRCNLSSVGRYKINSILGTDEKSNSITESDVFAILKHIFYLKKNPSIEIQDIDHLSNRRVRTADELIGNIVSSAMKNVVKISVDRMSNAQSGVGLIASQIFTQNQISKSIKDFMLTSQLSQLIDQTNPLSELSHTRRLSALGPGGVERDRVGIEVRDVHPTHYGRICIVETPDSQNIGLISNLACFARINQHGFIETPYRVVKSKKITDEIIYLDATKESHSLICSYNQNYMEKLEITDEIVAARSNGDFINISSEDIQFIDVAPNQPLSQTASLIPFCEANDSYRVLMSSNMHRQSVPVISPDAPLIATGFEKFIGMQSDSSIKIDFDGSVVYADSRKIIVKDVNTSDLHCFDLKKFERTNNSTCRNFRPCVSIGDLVSSGEAIADTMSSEGLEVSLGQNVKVAFMSWNGYGFEDSVIVSEKVVHDEKFSSINIEEFSVSVMDTRLGSEQITRSIPSVPESALLNLDESGIVKIGTFVSPGDILVGKVSPKAESPMTPEEKLLRAIFGDGKSDVKNTSLSLPSGYHGTVIDVQIFSRRGVEKIGTQVEAEIRKIHAINEDITDKLNIIKNAAAQDFLDRFNGFDISPQAKIYAKHKVITAEIFDSIGSIKDIAKIKLQDEAAGKSFTSLCESYILASKKIEDEGKMALSSVSEEKDFSNGVLYEIKVTIASKSNIQPGDKVAGRHGNKGVVSKIVPTADMPFMKDGTPIDVIINPLGIIARMNLGQVLELALGLASMELGKKVSQALKDYKNVEDVRKVIKDVVLGADLKSDIDKFSSDQVIYSAKILSKGIPYSVPVFSGANYEKVQTILENAGLDKSGQVDLYDGLTGEKFERKISVGILYILKLHHMVDKKIHARSVGPYSLITQQPLGGKTNFGGQRLGEMECWAVEAYGAAHVLNEMLTVKSDDIKGRKNMYSSIISQNPDYKSGTPESFNVLLKELSALGLKVSLRDEFGN
jgi:DNA-directed RNA polymerase subunit beta